MKLPLPGDIGPKSQVEHDGLSGLPSVLSIADLAGTALYRLSRGSLSRSRSFSLPLRATIWFDRIVRRLNEEDPEEEVEKNIERNGKSRSFFYAGRVRGTMSIHSKRSPRICSQ